MRYNESKLDWDTVLEDYVKYRMYTTNPKEFSRSGVSWDSRDLEGFIFSGLRYVASYLFNRETAAYIRLCERVRPQSCAGDFAQTCDIFLQDATRLGWYHIFMLLEYLSLLAIQNLTSPVYGRVEWGEWIREYFLQRENIVDFLEKEDNWKELQELVDRDRGFYSLNCLANYDKDAREKI